jgi:predicted methyltransferase
MLRNRLLVLTLLAAGALAPCAMAATPPGAISPAIADASRPASDRSQDADRHVAEVLAFADIHRGDTVVDLMPGNGYYTRLFSRLVGPRGRVYAVQPTEMDKVAPGGLKSVRGFAGKPPYDNVKVLVQPVDALHLPTNVDLVWTSKNYHDLHDKFMGPANVEAVNRAIFRALKSDGRYLVLDHAAAAGSGLAHTEDLHRIDPSRVTREVTSIGFRAASASNVLDNPDDTHTAAVFDPSIKGRTDQFLLAFRKP